jgi:DNA-directed RNA polymerase specialized sigma24 family protein
MTETIEINKKPIKGPIQKLDWPRMAEDGKTPLGIDIIEKQKDITRIVYKHFRVKNLSMEELLQEVFMTILHKNKSRSAHDPRKSSFSHYIYMVTNNICINIVQKEKRYEKESESIYSTHGGGEEGRAIIDTVPAEEKETPILYEKLDELSSLLRENGRWDLARYVSAVKSGAKSVHIREALSFKGKPISTKKVREMRFAIENFVKYNHQINS